MITRVWPILLAALVFTLPLQAADLSTINRSIKKEPVYHTKTPKYGLLAFGPHAEDRVWLVLDGDTLYVDRNGNGDLTEPGKKIAAKVDKNLDPAVAGYYFEVGDVRIGPHLHKYLSVGFARLERYAKDPSFKHRPEIQAAVKKDPQALSARIVIDVESATRKGGGLGGRISYLAGTLDLNGPLQFADSPGDAPIIHFDGPWEITFYGERPSFRVGREQDMVLVVGTPGRGPGTFAMVNYEDTIPEKIFPTIEIAYLAARGGEASLKELHELRERC